MTYTITLKNGLIALISILSIINWGYSQNLVLNGSFENLNSCPTRDLNFTQILKNVSHPTPASGDYFNSCGEEELSVPNNFRGVQEPAEGKGYAGLYFYALDDYREYLQLPFSSNLEKGRTYKVTLKISLAETSKVAIKKMSLVLANKDLKVDNLHNLSFSRIDLIKDYRFKEIRLVPDGFMDSNDKWINLSAEFEAKGYENHLIFGNFNANKDTKFLNDVEPKSTGDFAYYYIDDITVKETPKLTFKKDKIYVLEGKPYSPKGYKLDYQGIQNVKKIYKYLKKNADLQLNINGYADNSGSPEYNKFVSSLRARAVALYLKKLGIDEKRIVWQGLGEAKVDKKEFNVDRMSSKKVEFVITEFEDQ